MTDKAQAAPAPAETPAPGEPPMPYSVSAVKTLEPAAPPPGREQEAPSPPAQETGGQAAAGAKPEGKPDASADHVFGGDPAAGDGTSADKPTAGGTDEKPEEADDPVPEGDYAFDFGPEVEVSKEFVELFTPALKAAKVGAKAAQNLGSLFNDALLSVRKQGEEAFIAETLAWRKAAEADAELGGANWEATKASANKALKKYGTPELAAVLKATGLNVYPEMIRAFKRVAEATADDRIDVGNPASSPPVPPEVAWYERTTPTVGR